ncbi:hypothetical protein Y032_0012g1908 [Ancylostoma ceylanicum]|uniref:Reverse transcriptase domain-containing protein n=1 Tax=Ancylostoma ceylanicum TaxID=53326 RepID=A0A016VDG3_9BILA|nr:hypothetical protein Y032_0012g1908 [Ancylostoma ceylanicum]
MSKRWKDRLQRYGLRLHPGKTEYMECGAKIEDEICGDGNDLQEVECFKYLGSRFEHTPININVGTTQLENVTKF